MKKVKVLLLCAIGAGLTFTSCVKNSSEYKALQAERDSLALASAQTEAEFEQILTLLNEVEESFDDIKSKETQLSTDSKAKGELTPTTKQRIEADMQYVTETLQKNREKIADLEKRLKSSSSNVASLQKRLSSLQTQLEERTAELVALRDDLEKKDYQIAELSANVTTLNQDVQTLKVQSDAQKNTITKQQTELNTVYYCFGTAKELKQQNIIVNYQLGENLNKDYFIAKDINTFKVVPLYAKKGKLISKHPSGSYEFGKDADGKAELRITDTKNFWSLTKYLVVEVTM
jgi:chromosome segregation ATPase